jgi:hypothetical protein
VFSWTGGNLDLLGGLSAPSETYSQDALLSGSANKRLTEMQLRTTEFTRRILEDIAWYDVTNPDLDSTIRINTPLGRFTDHLRADEFDATEALEWDIDIVPYSMQLRTPIDRLRFLIEYVKQVVLPASDLIRQEGKQFSFSRLNALAAELSGVPEIEDLFVSLTDTRIPSIESPEPTVNRPAVTRHVTERIGRPGPSRAGRDHDIAMTMAGLSKQMARRSEGM